MPESALLATESFEAISDDELTALALAADPDAAIGDDAVCLWDLVGSNGRQILPDWYMPSPMGVPRLRYGWRRVVALVTIVAFISIDAYGLCSTYGRIVLA